MLTGLAKLLSLSIVLCAGIPAASFADIGGVYRGGADGAKTGRCNNNIAPGYCQTGVEVTISAGRANGKFGHGVELFNAMVAGKQYTGSWSTPGPGGEEIPIATAVGHSGDQITIPIGNQRVLELKPTPDGSELQGNIVYTGGSPPQVFKTPYTLRRVSQ